jgi:hypothetical protein
VLHKLKVNLLRGKVFLLLFASTRKPGTETKVEASPSQAGTTRWVGTNKRSRFSNGLQYFKKDAFVSAIPE